MFSLSPTIAIIVSCFRFFLILHVAGVVSKMIIQAIFYRFNFQWSRAMDVQWFCPDRSPSPLCSRPHTRRRLHIRSAVYRNSRTGRCTGSVFAQWRLSPPISVNYLSWFWRRCGDSKYYGTVVVRHFLRSQSDRQIEPDGGKTYCLI
jgi:hypothetical protein